MTSRLQWLSLVVLASLVGTASLTGCGESAPPPAPPVEVEETPDYTAGEAAYQN